MSYLNKPKNKIIQIVPAGSVPTLDGSGLREKIFLALCDDGSIWEYCPFSDPEENQFTLISIIDDTGSY